MLVAITPEGRRRAERATDVLGGTGFDLRVVDDLTALVAAPERMRTADDD